MYKRQGGQTAASQGINIERERLVIILAATLLTAGAVCLAGTIGWIGLVVPHIARRLIGDNARFALPIAAIFGAAFLLVIDTLAPVSYTHLDVYKRQVSSIWFTRVFK